MNSIRHLDSAQMFPYIGLVKNCGNSHQFQDFECNESSYGSSIVGETSFCTFAWYRYPARHLKLKYFIDLFLRIIMLCGEKRSENISDNDIIWIIFLFINLEWYLRAHCYRKIIPVCLENLVGKELADLALHLPSLITSIPCWSLWNSTRNLSTRYPCPHWKGQERQDFTLSPKI